jgi:hypothetical protein
MGGSMNLSNMNGNYGLSNNLGRGQMNNGIQSN